MFNAHRSERIWGPTYLILIGSQHAPFKGPVARGAAPSDFSKAVSYANLAWHVGADAHFVSEPGNHVNAASRTRHASGGTRLGSLHCNSGGNCNADRDRGGERPNR